MARGRIKRRRIGTEMSTSSLCAATRAWIRMSVPLMPRQLLLARSDVG
jgi:hypothetical protein